jgi:hypothetical protein
MHIWRIRRSRFARCLEIRLYPSSSWKSAGARQRRFDAKAARLHEENQRAFQSQQRGIPFMHTPEWELDQQQKRDQRMMRP